MTEAMRRFWRAHLPGGVPRGGGRLEDVPWPPTVVLTAEHDPLRDEGRAFAAAFRDRGREVALVEAPAMPHGFLLLPLDPVLVDPWEARLFG